ncbi:unnamed protein product [Chilo suppressalis]|uniref:Uncharacterized protein n=1 Tax=Chilo suppressalis TaxID=168631 RepID=A0ABN8AQB9_CHISP|nr:unnamed protein product [Chilo suppressalis]
MQKQVTNKCGGSGSKRSTLDIEGKIAEWRGRSAPSAPLASPPGPQGAGGGGGGGGGPGLPGAGTGGPTVASRALLDGSEVVCQLVPSALIDDLKTRLDAKDEDNESGIHESE